MFNLDLTLFNLRYITTTNNLLYVSSETFNDEYELSLISDIQNFNICGNNETSEFDLYCK